MAAGGGGYVTATDLSNSDLGGVSCICNSQTASSASGPALTAIRAYNAFATSNGGISGTAALSTLLPPGGHTDLIRDTLRRENINTDLSLFDWDNKDIWKPEWLTHHIIYNSEQRTSIETIPQFKLNTRQRQEMEGKTMAFVAARKYMTLKLIYFDRFPFTDVEANITEHPAMKIIQQRWQINVPKPDTMLETGCADSTLYLAPIVAGMYIHIYT